MLLLYHYPLCPKSRSIRVLLKEFDIAFETEIIDFVNSPELVSNLNPAGELPVIQDSTNMIFCDFYSIIEYLIDLNPNHVLIPSSIYQKSEMRRIISWVSNKFNSEVTSYILSEKLFKILKSNSSPRADMLRAAKINCSCHFDYFVELIKSRGKLITENLTIADIILACEISVLDYMHDIIWENYPILKDWYMLIKSRPSFRTLLSDKISLLPSPPEYYGILDF